MKKKRKDSKFPTEEFYLATNKIHEFLKTVLCEPRFSHFSADISQTLQKFGETMPSDRLLQYFQIQLQLSTLFQPTGSS